MAPRRHGRWIQPRLYTTSKSSSPCTSCFASVCIASKNCELSFCRRSMFSRDRVGVFVQGHYTTQSWFGDGRSLVVSVAPPTLASAGFMRGCLLLVIRLETNLEARHNTLLQQLTTCCPPGPTQQKNMIHGFCKDPAGLDTGPPHSSNNLKYDRRPGLNALPHQHSIKLLTQRKVSLLCRK